MAELRSVMAGYPGGGPALRNVSPSIWPGDFWAIVGPNGSGKSTLARTRMGMVNPEAGRVTLLGVGYVFPNPEHQFATDSVWEELADSVRQRKLVHAERRERVESALRLFGLEAVNVPSACRAAKSGASPWRPRWWAGGSC